MFPVSYRQEPSQTQEKRLSSSLSKGDSLANLTQNVFRRVSSRQDALSPFEKAVVDPDGGVWQGVNIQSNPSSQKAPKSNFCYRSLVWFVNLLPNCLSAIVRLKTQCMVSAQKTYIVFLQRLNFFKTVGK